MGFTNIKWGEKIMEQQKINVLVMGNSGCGKSTLINSVFEINEAEVGKGGAVTKRMQSYENKNCDFRLIDSRGLEYSVFEQFQIKKEINEWSKEGITKGNEKKYIHAIWYCIEGTTQRIFNTNLRFLKTIASKWKDIPIIVVITKSYSKPETEENIRMVQECISKFKKGSELNIVGIIPVVAKSFPINDEVIVEPNGVDLLIEKTNEILPEALRLNEEAVKELQMKIWKQGANSVVALASSGAIIVGAVPIPIADSAVLVPIQTSMCMKISRIYGVDKDKINEIGQELVKTSAVSLGAKGIISMIKAIPGLNIAASVINAIVAGVITGVLGEVTIILMEKVARGEMDINNLDVIKHFVDSEYTKKMAKYAQSVASTLIDKEKVNVKDIVNEILENKPKASQM